MGYNSAFFRKLTMLRVLRLIRIFQRLRIYPNFKLPWLLVKGVIDSKRFTDGFRFIASYDS